MFVTGVIYAVNLALDSMYKFSGRRCEINSKALFGVVLMTVVILIQLDAV